jgi:hypothetical protein
MPKAGVGFVLWFCKYVAPDGSGERQDHSPAIYGWVACNHLFKVALATAEKCGGRLQR